MDADAVEVASAAAKVSARARIAMWRAAALAQGDPLLESDRQSLRSALAALQPAAIERQEDLLFVVLPRRHVDGDALKAAVVALCESHAAGRLPTIDSAQIVVLSEFAFKGLAYAAGLESCGEVMSEARQPDELCLAGLILGHARYYTVRMTAR